MSRGGRREVRIGEWSVVKANYSIGKPQSSLKRIVSIAWTIDSIIPEEYKTSERNSAKKAANLENLSDCRTF